MDEALLCYCTCPTREVGETLARQLVAQRLAACVNVVPGLLSVYRWEGEVQSEPEVLLLIKTTRDHYAALEAALRAAHPYELPEIIAVSIAAGSPPYLQWLNAAVG